MQLGGSSLAVKSNRPEQGLEPRFTLKAEDNEGLTERMTAPRLDDFKNGLFGKKRRILTFIQFISKSALD